ncbi:putative FH protein interacting protein FIP2-like [Capsicum annuum]|nr:putative FH protein interacting protein FIP2-like [Capsicum annuum]
MPGGSSPLWCICAYDYSLVRAATYVGALSVGGELDPYSLCVPHYENYATQPRETKQTRRSASRLDLLLRESWLKQLVQELANCNEIPEKYIHAQGSINTSPPLLDVPQVDLRLLISPTSPARQEELNKLQSGLKSCGCFQVISHGMEDSFLDKVHEISKQFFALPTEEKLKYARTAYQIEGYGSDKVLTDEQRLDWEVLEEYIKNMKLLSESLLKAMATSLNVEENCFLDQCGDRQTMIARFKFYPPCPRPDVILGVKQHADASAITILLVPVVPYGFLVNVGDQVEIMSNDIFKSPMHRVVTNAERERNTLAVFIMPDVDVEIGPVDKLINEERPRAYKNVKSFVGFFFQSYQQGKRPIEAAKICQELHSLTTKSSLSCFSVQPPLTRSSSTPVITLIRASLNLLKSTEATLEFSFAITWP